MKAKRNPYVKLLERSVTIRLDRDTVEFFKALAKKTGLPYRSLINLYLRDSAVNRREVEFQWSETSRRTAA